MDKQADDLIRAAIYRNTRKAPDVKTKEIAYIMETDYQQLVNKTALRDMGAVLSLWDAIEIQEITGKTYIHDAIGLHFGLHSQPTKQGCPTSLMNAILSAIKEFGDVGESIDLISTSGGFTPVSRQYAITQIDEAIEALCSLKERVNKEPDSPKIHAVAD